MQCMYKIGTTGIDVATISFEVEKDDVESVLSLLKKRKNNGKKKRLHNRTGRWIINGA